MSKPIRIYGCLEGTLNFLDICKGLEYHSAVSEDGVIIYLQNSGKGWKADYEESHMKETVLLFNIADRERRIKIGRALLTMNIAVKAVPKEDYKQSIGSLTGNKNMLRTQEVYDGEELGGEMLLMAGIPGSKMERVLLALKKAGVTKDCLKAVLTDTNLYWNALQLYEEIKKEHDMMSGQPE